ncbi:hypothetical protein BU26DRAFT_607821 [Trematosphaeria pertusa]|uniref:Uncharacterized protein n=1 Tax=Trematosphaeria pertusa TaxID=390896 RepID=A0A6A6I5K9_9PLEO|nr:uncharacterized protein BU26DRAFT_607821 [Trematosphaeria pertusa]KAF2245606.1 hypothetical protein BU26DRAFT_607821 [Trematosphaeria pertusa]
MKTIRHPALWAVIVWVILSPFAVAQSRNITQTEAPPTESHQSGWRDGPKERGTLALIWSCLTTILACTWTILHLNVPSIKDTTWKKVKRKIKWMAITILFPEFIFSKAMCELRTAVEDLRTMSNTEDLGGWNVAFGRGVRLLWQFFNFFNKADDGDGKSETSAQEVSGEAVNSQSAYSLQRSSESTGESVDSQSTYYTSLAEKRRTWTLTHSYFANMGGLVWLTDSYSRPVTASDMVDCCLKEMHDPLPFLQLSVDEIRDRSKADWLVKTVAAGQISWLVVSVITRAVRRLPVTQLEICTVAFAALVIVTYAANWSKPKDVELPVLVPVPDGLRNELETVCTAWSLETENLEAFFVRLLLPSSPENGAVHRIGNDTMKKTQTNMLVISYWLTISTMAFGGLHCAAWGTEFPTNIEKVVWISASALSAIIPLINLISNAFLVG